MPFLWGVVAACTWYCQERTHPIITLYYDQAITVERVFPTQVSGEGVRADLGPKEQVCRLAGRTIRLDPGAGKLLLGAFGMLLILSACE
jgi:hypothetical protein